MKIDRPEEAICIVDEIDSLIGLNKMHVFPLEN